MCMTLRWAGPINDRVRRSTILHPDGFYLQKMSPSMLHFTELPAEILEQILLHMPGQDIIKMEVV